MVRLLEQPQLIHRDSDELILELPPAHSFVLERVRWGRHDCLFTPAYWAAQAWLHERELSSAPLRMGNTLTEEVVACLLGGHGTNAETGIAAYNSVRGAGLLVGSPTCLDIESILSKPMEVNGKQIRYRFWRRRAQFVAAAISKLKGMQLSGLEAREFRDALTAIDGIGLKTASWITRNWLDSDQVAVLDVHVVRAGVIMGLFTERDKDYHLLESKIIALAQRISVRASRLDALIWRQMKFSGTIGLRRYSEYCLREK